MRSSKSRSRNKSNRNRSVGNVVNRVFDSSGPEGKVRGTPQQVIDKYTQLARDAQLGNDRVAFENFQQHAEHYQRMLNEAQREQEARREEHERQNRDRQTDRDRDRGPREGGQRDRDARQGEDQHGDPARSPQPDIIEPAESSDSGLVETPEAQGENRGQKGEGGNAPRKPARKPRSRKPAKSGGDDGNGNGNGNGNGTEGGSGEQGGQDDQGNPDLSAGPSEAAE
ncbi:MAG: DUF4167 domain-containing protein [Roseovarius sp.]